MVRYCVLLARTPFQIEGASAMTRFGANLILLTIGMLPAAPCAATEPDAEGSEMQLTATPPPLESASGLPVISTAAFETTIAFETTMPISLVDGEFNLDLLHQPDLTGALLARLAISCDTELPTVRSLFYGLHSPTTMDHLIETLPASLDSRPSQVFLHEQPMTIDMLPRVAGARLSSR